jgi:hypothetical protein
MCHQRKCVINKESCERNEGGGLLGWLRKTVDGLFGRLGKKVNSLFGH